MAVLGLHSEAPSIVNFRSVGRGDGGLARKRRARSVRKANVITPSSIPAKFETILYKDNGEKKGFGGSAIRLSSEIRRPDGPGPGSYAITPRAETPGQGGVAATGAKGRGPFASRTPRLDRSLAHSSGTSSSVPGPGAYEVLLGDIPSPRAFRPPLSAAFAPTGPGNLLKNEALVAPGPGEYDSLRPLGADARACSLRTTSARIPALQFQDTPGPGQYADGDPYLTATSQPFGSAPKLSSRRRLVPATESFGESALYRKVLEHLESDRHDKQKVPGPGAYEPHLEATRGKEMFSKYGMSSFQLGTSHLPRTWRPALPGPGEYETLRADMAIGGQLLTRERSLSPTPFVSRAQRFQTPAGVAPGPAYYAPTTQANSISFHLNTQNNWV